MMLYGDWAPGKTRTGDQQSTTGDCARRPLPELQSRSRDSIANRQSSIPDSSCRLINVEGPILPSDHTLEPWPKAGPSLFSTSAPSCDGPLVCSLANNHAMDYGELGLALTRELLRTRGAVVVGASATRAASREPVIVTDGGVRVAIIACCEAQFGAAEAARAGVAVVGPWVPDAIQACRAQADGVVVSVHAGAELSPWPAPALQDLYRSWIDAGANVIHGHHPHVPQGFEEYHGALILYGLGNLAVNPQDWEGYPNALWSLAAEVDFAAQPLEWRIHTLALRGDDDQVDVVPDEYAEHSAYVQDCNRALRDRGLLEALWQEVAVRAYRQHYRAWLGFPPEKKPRAGDRPRAPRLDPSRALPGKASRQDLRLWYHLYACLTHADSIATALGVLCGELTDLRTAESRALVDGWMPWTVPQAAAVEVPV
jgi:hypothetical protein